MDSKINDFKQLANYVQCTSYMIEHSEATRWLSFYIYSFKKTDEK